MSLPNGMPMIRVFIALSLPDDVRSRLAGLAGGVQKARWVEQHNLHLTLRFIGETYEDRLPDLDAELRGIKAAPFELSLSGTGQFGNRRGVHTLWVGAEPSSALTDLQTKVEAAVVRAGFPAEGRKFSPHVTLARLTGSPLERVIRYLVDNSLFRSGPFPIESITLYESRQSHHGPDYTIISCYPL